MSTKDLSKD
jgi:hypothetical protein